MLVAARILAFVGGALGLVGAGCNIITVVLIFRGIPLLLAAVLGLVGGGIMSNQTMLGAILCLAGGVIALYFVSFTTGPLLVVAGILGLVVALQNRT